MKMNSQEEYADMEKEYFISINEVSKRLNVPAYTLRYWEKQFPTIIRPTTGAGGRRYYRPEMVDRLTVINDLLYNRGMTIAGVKKMLRNGELPQTLNNTPMQSSDADTGASALDGDKIDLIIDMLIQTKNMLS